MYWSSSESQEETSSIVNINNLFISSGTQQKNKIQRIISNYQHKHKKQYTFNNNYQHTDINQQKKVQTLNKVELKLAQAEIIKSDVQEDQINQHSNSFDRGHDEYDDQIQQERKNDELYHKTNVKSSIIQYCFTSEEGSIGFVNKKYQIDKLLKLQQTYKIMQQTFKEKYNIQLVQIRYVIHKKQQTKIVDKKKDDLNYFRTIQNSIDLIMNLYQKGNTNQRLISFSDYFNRRQQQSQQKNKRNWRDFQDHTYVYFKLLIYNYSQFMLKKLFLPLQGKVIQFPVAKPKRQFKMDYWSQPRQLITIKNWQIGTIINNEYYQCFSIDKIRSSAERISPRIQSQIFVYFNRYGNKIKQIVIINKLFNRITLKVLLKCQKISSISYHSKTDQQLTVTDTYLISLSNCPEYYISISQNNRYISTQFQMLGERIQNFVLLSHNQIKDNQLLKMFMYNNSVVKLQLVVKKTDRLSSRFKQNIDQITKSYKKYMELKLLNELPAQNKNMFNLEKMFNQKELNSMLNNFKIQTRPIYTQHIIWKVKYHILLLLRYNLIDSSYQQLIQIIKENINDLQYCSKVVLSLVNSVRNKDVKQSSQQIIVKMKQKINKRKNKIQNQIKNESQQVDLQTQMDVEEVEDNKLMCKVYKMLLTPSGIIFNTPTPEKKNRLLRRFTNQSEFFGKLTLMDDSDQMMKNKKYLILYFMRKFLGQTNILDKRFIPMASSNSQLRASSLWIINEINSKECSINKINREMVLQFLGNFNQIDVAAKKYARIGQSFSSSWTFDGSNIKTQKIADVYGSGYMFTDGIGKIQNNLLTQISKILPYSDLLQTGICCIQIRYQGVKGVLTKNINVNKDTIVLRPSMIKYECKDSNINYYFDVLDWNKFKSGFLNRQLVILFTSLNIKDEVFQNFQKQYIQFLEQMTYRQVMIFRLLHTDFDDVAANQQPSYQIVGQMSKVQFQLDNQPFYQGVLSYLRLKKIKEMHQNCHILIKKSARIIGIIDEYDLLQEGQIFCTIFNYYQKQKTVTHNITGNVVVSKNPALDPADVRKMKCVSLQQIDKRCQIKNYPTNVFQDMVNCVIFPCKGEYPVTSMISGSDLDGDCFFICWDEHLLIEKQMPPVFIDTPTNNSKQVVKVKKVVGYDEMMDFVVEYINSQKLGVIDNNHLVHADKNNKKFANCKICKKLAQYHGKAVDFGKSGSMPEVPAKLLTKWFPSYLRQTGMVYESRSILGILHKYSKCYVDSMKQQNYQSAVGNFDKQIISNYSVQISDKEVQQIISQLLYFQISLFELMQLMSVQTQFQIYLGYFDSLKLSQKNMGVNRIYMFIILLRRKYFDKFFNQFSSNQKSNYHKINYKTDKNVQIDIKIIIKCLKYYFVSYLAKFEHFSENLNQKMNDLQKRVRATAVKYKYEAEYFGFVWFVVPKLMIQAKRRTLKTQKSS